VASKELTGTFVGCVASKGVTSIFLASVARKEVMGLCSLSERLVECRKAYRRCRANQAGTIFPDIPAEDFAIEVRAALDVGGGHFDLADLAVDGGRHNHSACRLI